MGRTFVFKRLDSFGDRARSQDTKYASAQEALDPEAERRRAAQRRHAAILAIYLLAPIHGLADPEASTPAALTRVKVFPPATWREQGAVPVSQVLWRLGQATPDRSNGRQLESRRFQSKIPLAGSFQPQSPTQVDRARPRSSPVRVRTVSAFVVPGSADLLSRASRRKGNLGKSTMHRMIERGEVPNVRLLEERIAKERSNG